MANLLLILKAVVELLPVITKLISLYAEAKKKGWVKDGNELQQKIQSSQTNEERMDIAKRLFEHRPQ